MAAGQELKIKEHEKQLSTAWAILNFAKLKLRLTK